MTGRERIEKAFLHREPDRVPIWEMAFNEQSIINIGAFFTDDLPQLQSVHDMTLQEKLALLTLLFSLIEELELDGFPSLVLVDSAPAGEGFVRDVWGSVYQLSEAGEPVIKDGPISRPDDLAGFSPYRPQESDFIMLAAAKERFGNSLSQILVHPGPFQLSRNLTGGMERFFPYIRTNPRFVHDIMRMTTDYVLDSLHMGIGLGADIICLDGDFAYNRSTFMSPDHYGEFFLPYHREIVELAHSRDKWIFKHSDGNMWPLMDQLVEAGFDGFHPIQPQCMDIGKVKARYGDRLCLIGNIDCAFLLPSGSEEEVEGAVAETISLAAPGGGFILSSSNSIHPGCKPENYIAMVKATREYGSYPIGPGS